MIFDIKKELGEILSEYRKKEGLTRIEVCKKTKIKSTQLLYNFESGKSSPTWKQLKILLDFYDGAGCPRQEFSNIIFKYLYRKLS